MYQLNLIEKEKESTAYLSPFLFLNLNLSFLILKIANAYRFQLIPKIFIQWRKCKSKIDDDEDRKI